MQKVIVRFKEGDEMGPYTNGNGEPITFPKPFLMNYTPTQEVKKFVYSGKDRQLEGIKYPIYEEGKE